ncbi:MAG TPA: TIR domain-containing protein [Terriglobales bacterium]|nr:TIR domain-containing protein [Terriglobales bacterium]
MKRQPAKKRFAVGAAVRVLMPGVNGVVIQTGDEIAAMGEYWHIIRTKHGECNEPGSNLELIPKPIGGESESATRTERSPAHAENEGGAVAHTSPLVFISHSSKDEALALALVELLRAGLGLLANQIRCSSVDGYRLPVGVNSERKLREEVNAAKVAIGLITPSSLSSYFVMFELGARWGADLFLAPLLAGVKASELKGPLNLLNALSASNEAQLCQLLSDIAKNQGLTLQDASAYLRHVAAVKLLADDINSAPSIPVAASPIAQPGPEIRQVGTTNYYYVGNKGSYCQPCYDLNHKLITLMPGQDYLGGFGRKCEVCNKVFMEGPRKKTLKQTQVRGSGTPWS